MKINIDVITVLYLEYLGYDEMMMIRLSQLHDVEMNDQADVDIQINLFNVELIYITCNNTIIIHLTK